MAEDEKEAAANVTDAAEDDGEPSDSVSEEEEKTDLEKFYERLAYNIPDGPKVRERTTALAQPTKHHITGLYDQYKNVLSPIGRKKRIERKVIQYNAMTTEDLENVVKKREVEKIKQAKNEKKKGVVYRSLLHKLEIKCREKFISDVYQKYADVISKDPSIVDENFKFQPDNIQRVIDYIFYNLLASLKIHPDSRDNDRSLYRAIATIIALSILDVLYEAQTEEDKDDGENQLDKADNDISCGILPCDDIKKRAMLGAEVKVCSSAKRKKVRSKAFEQVMEMCKSKGCR